MKRFLSFSLSFVLVVMMMPVIPVSAVGFHETPVIEYTDTSAVSSWSAHFSSLISSLDVLSGVPGSLMWAAMDNSLQGVVPGSKNNVREVISSVSGLNSWWLETLDTLFDRVLPSYAKDSLSLDVGIGFDDTLGVYRPYDRKTGLPIVNSKGQFPYYKPEVSAAPDEDEQDRSLGGKWVRVDKVNWNRVNILSEYSFYDIGYALRDYGEDNEVDVRYVDGDPVYEYLVSRDRYENGIPFVYCDKDGQPYVNRPDPDAWAQEQDNNWIIDDDGNTENGQLIDVDTNTVWFPDGTLNFINNLVYDESQKTYYVDASSSYDIDNNYYYTYNYHYEYHIDYTSITYIGQTAEYDEVYEYYYQLPDGRSSADLTADELLALNTQIDVLPYIRSADDTSIRALYHFDGDTRDSSYWSHLGEFKWNEGASLTYMNAGAFEGALYLDENAHDFTVALPSNIGSNDFTVQFRYYQSHTLTPAEDAYLAFSGVKFLRANGESWMNSLGNVISPISVGNWNEICLMRRGGVLHYFVNGVCVNQLTSTRVLDNTLQFVFGADQQTYKYFDELRVVNEAVYPITGYMPTSVPHDTNLALVLPDSKLPVADEYWSFQSGLTNLFASSGYDTWSGEVLPAFDVKSTTLESMNNGKTWTGTTLRPSGAIYPLFGYHSALTTVNSYDNAMSIVIKKFTDTNGYSLPKRIAQTNFSNAYYAPTYGIHMQLGGNPSSNLVLPPGDYTLSMVDMEGNVGSLSFTVPTSVPSSTTSLALLSFNGYRLEVYSIRFSSSVYYLYLTICPEEFNTENEFAYLQLVSGDSTDLTAEWVESVVAMDKDDLNTPSLAVRTDIDITGYQLGGVRPSLPSKGLVWALVEDGRITSLQIYNGQAWEEVDGRIWTGSRWVPYYAYDVLLLKDMYDIVEADPSLNPIYTEAGFWKWLQEAWGEMMAKLDQIIVALGGKPSTGEECSHTYESKISREATCSEPGHMTYTCSQCGHKYTELIDAHGHDWTVVNSVPDVLDENGSVIEEGYEELVCTVCDTQSRDYGEGPEEVEFFDAVGDFIADGITWILDKLEELADSLRGITEIFNSFRDRISGMAGGFPLFFAGIVALLPEDLMAVLWFFVIGWIVLKVWKKWSN